MTSHLDKLMQTLGENSPAYGQAYAILLDKFALIPTSLSNFVLAEILEETLASTIGNFKNNKVSVLHF